MGEEDWTRRGVLRGVVGGATFGAFAGWFAPEGQHVPEIDLESGDLPPADPLDESETPYAVYQYSAVAGTFRETLPINLVSPLDDATFEELTDVLSGAGWYRRPAEQIRYAYDRETDRWSRSHWSGVDSVFGIAPRVHVRCWNLSGTASLQAHIDTPPSPHHRIRSFARGAAIVVALFEQAGWDINRFDPNTIDLGNAQPPDHNGTAVVLQR